MEKNKFFMFVAFAVFFVPYAGAAVINEIMYAPLESEFYNEYIEIYNDGDSHIDLANWTLCGDSLLAGYVEKSSGQLKLNSSTILPKGNYAIITDGGSGTEVYGNFNVNEYAVAMHVDSASLCGGLVNSGETIILKDSPGNLISSVTYASDFANNNGKSLQLCSGSWTEENPTPGSANSCPAQSQQNNQQNENADSTDSSGSVTDAQNSIQSQNSSELISKNDSQNSESSNVKFSSAAESPDKNAQADAIILNADSKNIKSGKKLIILNKDNYPEYIFGAFAFLLAILFLLKHFAGKKYKNEFNG